ncbi:TPA: hypothetical protein ACSQMU_005259 [Pseudomonas aeruginosa]|nr:hypothetical protein [Pseudomonas aeruginosa]
MKEYLSLFNTDQLNKYGYRFSIDALESGLKQSWELGTPMFISHDFHRPLGWSKPLGLRIFSDQVELMGLSSFAENGEEQNKINTLSSRFISYKIQTVSETDKDSLVSGREHLLTGSEIFAIRECISLVDENIARKSFPNLFQGDEQDKRSLCSLKDLKVIAPGVFEYEGYAVFAHRFFRRSLSQFNNLNMSFLSRLVKLCNSGDLDVKISLDPHSIGLINTYAEPIELDYWWGPKFSDSLLDIPAGVTKHENTERGRFFSGISATEFWWHKQNGIQSLECEELRDNPSYGVSGEDYGCRYVHSMVNAKGHAYHLDGAIRLYDEESYINRLEEPISNAGKTSTYFKLWRIDGDIPLSTWKELICDFYKDNHLIGEYFGGVDSLSEQHSLSLSTERSEDPLHKYTSKSSPNDKSQIFISYHPLETFPGEQDVEVVAIDSIVSGDMRINVIELEAIDLLKDIRKSTGSECSIPKHVKLIAYEDFDINFPLFVCRGEDSISNANKIIQCVRSISLSKLASDDRIITASVCVAYPEAVVKYAIACSIKALHELLEPSKFSLPDSFSKISEWIEIQSECLKMSMSEQKRTCPDRSLLKNIGDFRVCRRFAERSEYEINGNGEFIYKVHSSNAELVDLMIERRSLFLTPVYIIQKAQCRGCRTDYLKCKCLAVFHGAGVNIKKMRHMGVVWSSRNFWSAHYKIRE